jgi:hypothetical protein
MVAVTVVEETVVVTAEADLLTALLNVQAQPFLVAKERPMAEEKDKKVDNNLQGNLGASPEVDTINEGTPKEKFPANEIRDWEKSQQDSNITEVKGPENSVEKTMDLLAEKGQEGGSKKAANTIQERIKVNGHVYRRVGTVPPAQVLFRGAIYELDED